MRIQGPSGTVYEFNGTPSKEQLAQLAEFDKTKVKPGPPPDRRPEPVKTVRPKGFIGPIQNEALTPEKVAHNIFGAKPPAQPKAKPQTKEKGVFDDAIRNAVRATEIQRQDEAIRAQKDRERKAALYNPNTQGAYTFDRNTGQMAVDPALNATTEANALRKVGEGVDITKGLSIAAKGLGNIVLGAQEAINPGLYQNIDTQQKRELAIGVGKGLPIATATVLTGGTTAPELAANLGLGVILGVTEEDPLYNIAGNAVFKLFGKLGTLLKAGNEAAWKEFTTALEAITPDPAQAEAIAQRAKEMVSQTVKQDAERVLSEQGIEGLRSWSKEQGHELVEKTSPAPAGPATKTKEPKATPKANIPEAVDTAKAGEKIVNQTPAKVDSPPATGLQKEPWQMTRDEAESGGSIGAQVTEQSWNGRRLETRLIIDIDQLKRDSGINNIDLRQGRDGHNYIDPTLKGGPGGGRGWTQEEKERIVEGLHMQGYRGILPDKFVGSGDYSGVRIGGSEKGRIHFNTVEQALKEGKPVPPEVLADYPDLAKKYGIDVTEQPPIRTIPTEDVTSKEKINAEEIRKDTGQVREGRKPDEGLQDKGSQDFQRPKEAGAEAGKPKDEVTGLANQVLRRKALQNVIDEVQPTKGQSPEAWQKQGKQAVDAGRLDPETLARRIASGEEELTGEKVGALLEGQRRLENAVNAAADGDEYIAARAKLNTFLEDVQQGKGRWSDVGRALQAGTTLNEGDFAKVLTEVKRTGGRLSEKAERQLKELSGKVAASDKEIQRLTKELESERLNSAVQKEARSPRAKDKEKIKKEIDDLWKEFASAGGRVTSGIDPERLVTLGKIATAYARLGAANVEELVIAVQKAAKERLGIDVDRQDIIDSFAPKAGRTRTEAQKEYAKLKTEARSLSTQGNQKRLAEVQKRIDELNKELSTGEFRTPSAKERELARELQRLQDRKGLLQNEVRARIADAKPKTVVQRVSGVIQAPKSILSSIDISAPGRQGWILGLSNPDRIPVAFWEQLKAMASPIQANRMQQGILNRPNADLYKRAKLYLAPLTGGEEMYAGQLFSKWRKYNPFTASERAYTAYLNRIRADVFDRMVKALGKKYTDDDLKIIANYINVASGRGGKSIPGFDKGAEVLNHAMFSPRFVASRFEYILGQPLGTTGASWTKSAKGRALVAKEYAKFLGALGGVLTLAKMNGAEVETDAASADFGKVKIGNQRIDFGAGLLQTAVFLNRMATGRYKTTGGNVLDLNNPKYGGPNKLSVLGRFARSKASPTAGVAASGLEGKNYIGEPVTVKSTLKDLISPLSVKELVEGLRADGWDQKDAITLLNFLGISTQDYDTKQKEEKKIGGLFYPK